MENTLEAWSSSDVLIHKYVTNLAILDTVDASSVSSFPKATATERSNRSLRADNASSSNATDSSCNVN